MTITIAAGLSEQSQYKLIGKKIVDIWKFVIKFANAYRPRSPIWGARWVADIII